MTPLLLAAVFLVAATAAGLLLRRRNGRIRPSDPAKSARASLLAGAGVGAGVPVVLHFSATWCGPCAAVRRVVAAVTADLADSPAPPLDVELDIDAEPDLARELNVLSLPTTFVFDGAGQERFRISGVPKAAELRSALSPLADRKAA
ncbi:thioredoxin family protein [Nocardia stercoris]|uniref:Thioredoxin n=1 Tax=Nocardia stercoris TaxID=2483361 RepID=A0A3M2KWL5_9NOCA|nr:thioredoxin family protein [Nocardia stercoris]RMI29621.1 thioredoxin [Nocardia stercoris]